MRTSYYSGYLFQQVNPSPTTAARETREYVVVEDSDNPHKHLPVHQEVQRLINNGELNEDKVVYRWKEREGKGRTILIYAVPAAR